ncbi:MAG: hypothetical protein AABN95_06700 [Acidobacteriota bacterium]
MIRLRSHISILCLLLVFSTFAFSQQLIKPASEKEQEAERQAFEMLDSIAESIPGLLSSDNRIHLTAAVAEMLWSKDEKRARSLFESLTKEVSTVMASLDPTEQRSLNAIGVIQQHRREIVERIARRDPEMSLAFLRGTRPPAGMTSQNNDYLSEANLELYLVGLIAQKDPEQALQMARASLRRGVTYSLVSVLFNIASKNPDAARTLHVEIVDKLKSADLINNNDLANSAWNLLGAFQPPQANEDAHRSLVELLASAVLSVKPNVHSGNSVIHNFSNQVPAQMAQFQKYAPARVNALKQWSQQTKRTMDPGSRMYQELNEVTQKGTLEDILALAGKYGPEHHLQIYQQAANKASSSGDPNRARQIIMEFVPDGPQRRQMLEQLDNQLFWSSVTENKVAEARQALDRIKSVEQRFQLLLGLATNLINRGEKKQATSLLSEATALLDTMPGNSSKVTAQLQLAQCYSSLDSQQSVAILQSVIALANQLVAAAAVLDGFENSYLKEGEWMKRGYTNLGSMVNNIQQNLGTLARVDAEGARSLSNQLERPEIRLMAQLEIVRSMLSRGSGGSNFSRIVNSYPLRRH